MALGSGIQSSAIGANKGSCTAHELYILTSMRGQTGVRGHAVVGEGLQTHNPQRSGIPGSPRFRTAWELQFDSVSVNFDIAPLYIQAPKALNNYCSIYSSGNRKRQRANGRRRWRRGMVQEGLTLQSSAAHRGRHTGAPVENQRHATPIFLLILRAGCTIEPLLKKIMNHEFLGMWETWGGAG